MPQLRDPLCYRLEGVCTSGFAYELRTPQHGAPNQVQVIGELVAVNHDKDKTIVDVGVYDGRSILWAETRALATAGYWYRFHGEFTLLTDQVIVFRWRTLDYETQPADIAGSRIAVNVFGYVTEKFTTP